MRTRSCWTSPHPRALDNINTPEEYGSARIGSRSQVRAQPEATADAQQINVQYYALLREQAGRSEETLVTTARTPRELYEELRERHPFSLAPRCCASPSMPSSATGRSR